MTETPLPASSAASPLIRLAGVTKRFGDADVLTDISLEIATGETVVICGPSGSGKSTLIRLINQLEEQTSGEISLDGRALASLSSEGLRALRGDVGFVFQQFNLFAPRAWRRACPRSGSPRAS
ncbi:ATP-binding cassette domain-containing protein [Brevundimonas naejangsanensis]|uniref:ATP-binding cassette domain-containing protein n=1 Tax=Brevundimonas naejangsanensis TaxID=588932 RepID=UPI00320A8961